jgi:hypothetical protein
MSTFIICAPIIHAGMSNGIQALLSLSTVIESLGHTVFFCSIISEFPEPEIMVTDRFKVLFPESNWNTMFELSTKAAKNLKIRLLTELSDDLLNNAIFIYGERIIKNPLGAKRVVRFFGNRNGYLNGGTPCQVQEKDCVLSHSRIFHKSPDASVFFSKNNPLFTDEGSLSFQDRKINLNYVGKGDLYGNIFRVGNTEMLQRDQPDTKEALASLLKKTRFLFLFDSMSNLISEAIFCGAIPVILRYFPYTPDDLDQIETGPVPRVHFDDLVPSGNLGENISFRDATTFEKYQNERTQFIKNVHRQNDAYFDSVKSFVDRVLRHFCTP